MPSMRTCAMRYPILFEIPVYYCKGEKSLADRAKAEDRIKRKTEESCRRGGQLSPAAEKQMYVAVRYAIERFRQWQWPYWKYNEVIGWLSVDISRTQIRAEVFKWEYKRFDRRSRKIYELVDHRKLLARLVSGSDFGRLHEKLIDRIQSYVKATFPKGAWADVSMLENLGPFINWERLISSAPP